jgi:hypothetical protein
MTLEVRQLVLRAKVRDEPDLDDDDEDDEDDEQSSCCGGQDGPDCEDNEALKEEILKACRAMVREELRGMRRER